ncbi:MAG: hypothetical protein V4651_06455 [Bacteroidota bacterium]
MAITVINTHKVADFSKWKEGFEAGATMRKQAGILITGVFQHAEDANEVTVISEFPDLETAKAIVSSPGMRETMQKSGAIEEPRITFLTSIN